jgi:AdoMet-dependent heme synthase
MDLAERPFIAIWEMTQACDLACKHCRACARPERDAGELDTEQAKSLLEDLRGARVPLVVLTGGDPAKRPDLLTLVRYGSQIGLHMALTPSATPSVTPALLEGLSLAGLKRLAVSVDGPNATVHDAFRGVDGSFAEAFRILETAAAIGLPRQVNTTVHAGSAPGLRAIADRVASIGAVLWSVFFVVPIGRARADMLPSADRVEELLEEIGDIATGAPFAVKTTAAPHYRRVLAAKQERSETSRPGAHARVRINDGRGFVFVSHQGEVFPSGFLPISCGNVRDSNVVDIYRSHPLFHALRDPNLLEGKCGACDYRSLCGGSRARAFGMTGSTLASDPLCAYVPPGYTEHLPRRAPRHLEVFRG